jgi:hypothetical protein
MKTVWGVNKVWRADDAVGHTCFFCGRGGGRHAEQSSTPARGARIGSLLRDLVALDYFTTPKTGVPAAGAGTAARDGRPRSIRRGVTDKLATRRHHTVQGVHLPGGGASATGRVVALRSLALNHSGGAMRPITSAHTRTKLLYLTTLRPLLHALRGAGVGEIVRALAQRHCPVLTITEQRTTVDVQIRESWLNQPT